MTPNDINIMKKLALIAATLGLGFFQANAQEVDYGNVSDKRSAYKMELFSPLTGNLTLGYERYLKNWMGIEAKLGIIGIGSDPENREALGGFVKVGPKFKLKPVFVEEGMRGSHYLRGSYIRPELAISLYSQNDLQDPFDNTNDPNRETVSSVAFLINFGKQYVLSNVMTLDWSFGIGYGISTGGEERYNFGYTNGPKETPLAMSAGFTIGFLGK